MDVFQELRNALYVLNIKKRTRTPNRFLMQELSNLKIRTTYLPHEREFTTEAERNGLCDRD